MAPEHQPGVDDVYFLTFDGGRTIHVDKHVFDAVRNGEALQKDAWSRKLQHAGQTLTAKWSVDAARMLLVMPAVLAVLAALTITATKPGRENEGDPKCHPRTEFGGVH